MEERTASPEQLHEREAAILRRLAAGLSDQLIADELHLSLHTIKWYNRQIYAKLGVKSRTQAIAYAQSLGLLPNDGAGALPHPPGSPLPTRTTPFIGRSRERAEVAQLLGRSRLLTLTGSGGAGKTRLALQVAEAIAGAFADGARFVDLASLGDHSLVPGAIAAALGLVEQAADAPEALLQRALARREMLLLLDNFEHVVAAAPLLSALLAAAPGLKLLVTSREPLRLAGEQEYAVPPLSVPPPEAVSVQSLAESEAGALFIQRARLVQPRFEATAANASAIARICIRLDGLPLAIELAAARCKLLTPQALLARLEVKDNDAVFQLLAGNSRDAPPRQRSLRHTLAWSYNLLSADEQRLFARLAVFQGWRSLEAIEAVCAEGLAITLFDGLASLVDKSLVQQHDDADGEPQFVLLEIVLAYARERLEASGEAPAISLRHATYVVALAERAEPELRRSGYDRWCRVFEREMGNIRAALEWSLRDASAAVGGLSLGVRLVAALGLFWYGEGYHVEGFRWAQQLLAHLGGAPTAYHPRFLISAGRLAWFQDLDLGRSLIKRALDCARELGDALQSAWALAFLSFTLLHEPRAALPMAEEALAAFRQFGHLPGVAQTLNIIGEIARVNGDRPRAQQVYEECLAVCQQTGETSRIAYMYGNLAFLAQHAGDTERARQLAQRKLQLSSERGRKSDIADSIIIIAGSLSASAAPDHSTLRRAAQLLGAAEAEYERLGTFMQPGNMPEYQRILSVVHAHLDEQVFRAAWAEGRGLTLAETIAQALKACE